MSACTEPVRTGIGAVCVEYGRRKWPITMLNHTDIPGTEKCFYFLFLAPYARTTRYEGAFLPKGKKRPHYDFNLELDRACARSFYDVEQLFETF